MKKVFPIVLIFSFLLQSFGYLAIYADYQINKEYIAKNLCENRDRPEMKCHGKCQLCKRLKAEDTKDQKGLPNYKNVKQFVLFSMKNKATRFEAVHTLSKSSYCYTAGNSSLHKMAVFHPPLV